MKTNQSDHQPARGDQKKHNVPYLLLVILALAGAYYFVFDPRDTSLPMLKCPFHMLTGLSCPACGLQRAIHLTLHGHPLAALSYNYFLIIAIPFALLLILAQRAPQDHKFDWAARIANHRYTLITFTILFIAWWIIRNVMGM